MELWMHDFPAPLEVAKVAAEAEEAGWDGLAVPDSQNLTGDVYVALTLAAMSTERLLLGTATGNSATRVAAVNAGASISVNLASGGRMVLGIGRGDSALAHLGRAPVRLAPFEQHLKNLQAYLSGGEVPFDEVDLPPDLAGPSHELELGEGPAASRLVWDAVSGDDSVTTTAKVPVEVSATGPEVIAIAARHAERVMFAVGADPDRLQWGMEVARQARRDAGLDPDGVQFGAYIQCVCHPDLDAARQIVRGPMSIFARMQMLQGTLAGPSSADNTETLKKLHDVYDMTKPSRGDSAQAAALPDEFIDRFGVVGPPDRVIDKLRDLEALGLDKVVFAGQFTENTYTSSEGLAARRLLEAEVLPVMRAEVAR